MSGMNKKVLLTECECFDDEHKMTSDCFDDGRVYLSDMNLIETILNYLSPVSLYKGQSFMISLCDAKCLL